MSYIQITSKRAFFSVTIMEQLHTKTRRRWKLIFILLLRRKAKEMVDFSSLSKYCVFYSFCHCFSVKFLTRYLARVWFYCEHLLLKLRVSIDPFLLF